ncbi:ammonia-forming cytochrome c nitrite reductase subunit c552 [Salisediminibacterium selenitireducens]|uniref:nitrite reductase (cytochrome; ammonia-forming) n=1 Tax=Bacillus selenitireducens (strain ATCC 700615 / DSM 15326 / MLS10) TaxID=439292 RepID=D6XSM9_BACIE|nr:ammonia-forming cytochrome c nitrite reductase subunit c552 [Salisediminibacterium selenitireducens]ADH98815.1 Nitrite reductase (cytochrome; ammonia-forming) [[Bacillus] selenitireducens MLS10]
MKQVRSSRYLFILMILFSIGLAACSGDEENEPETTDTTSISPDKIVNTAFQDKHPVQYESYLKNAEQSGPLQSKFATDIEPNLPMLFHNYGFMLEYNKPRGHGYAVEDVINIARINDNSIGSCMTCKSTAVPALIDEMGDDYWSANFRDEIVPRTLELGAGGESEHLGEFGHMSVGCSDCHDPATMELRISRPSFTNAMDRRGIDVTEASHNDMRSYVCAQCHVEYYFEPENQKVTHPWDNGLKPEDMFEYKENQAKDQGFDYDWVHSISGAPMLKAQHPEFEIWSYGPHGEAGVACADCHMPDEPVDGGGTSPSHHWTSPMDNIESACLSCHSETTEEQMRAQVDAIQERHIDMMHETQWFSVRAHYYVNRMITAGADEEKIEEARYEIRKGQWFWDIIAAENSDGFHNPQGGADAMRTSVEASVRAIRIAEAELTGLGEDLNELERQIEETMENVYNEGDPHEKHTHAVNEYFPNVLELDY